METIDFEAEARAWLELTEIRHRRNVAPLAAKLREAADRAVEEDVREMAIKLQEARSEGEAVGFRRGVEAAAAWFEGLASDTAEDMRRNLLPPEPAKVDKTGPDLREGLGAPQGDPATRAGRAQ